MIENIVMSLFVIFVFVFLAGGMYVLFAMLVEAITGKRILP